MPLKKNRRERGADRRHLAPSPRSLVRPPVASRATFALKSARHRLFFPATPPVLSFDGTSLADGQDPGHHLRPARTWPLARLASGRSPTTADDIPPRPVRRPQRPRLGRDRHLILANAGDAFRRNPDRTRTGGGSGQRPSCSFMSRGQATLMGLVVIRRLRAAKGKALVQGGQRPGTVVRRHQRLGEPPEHPRQQVACGCVFGLAPAKVPGQPLGPRRCRPGCIDPPQGQMCFGDPQEPVPRIGQKDRSLGVAARQSVMDRKAFLEPGQRALGGAVPLPRTAPAPGPGAQPTSSGKRAPRLWRSASASARGGPASPPFACRSRRSARISRARARSASPPGWRGASARRSPSRSRASPRAAAGPS